MAASLDGFIARRNGSVDWMETADSFEGGEVMAPSERVRDGAVPLEASLCADVRVAVAGARRDGCG